MPLSTQQVADLKKAGIDVAAIDWTKVLQLIQLIISLFANNPPALKAALKAKGCPDEVCQCLCDAISHNLAAAQDCVQCCC